MSTRRHLELVAGLLPLPKRLDVYLTEAAAGEFSREEIKQCVLAGAVKLNGKTARPSDKVQSGDRITADLLSEKITHLEPQEAEFGILYEDDELLVIDKPSGLVVHPGAGQSEGTLVHGLLARQKKLADRGGFLRPGIVHRLDKETSGVLLVAKTNTAHRKLQAQFAARTMNKIYWALVHGRVAFEEGHLDAPIGPDPKERQKRTVVRHEERGREALTRYRVLERMRAATLLEVKLETGRTHQIRVHLRHLGHPVMGDVLYGPKIAASGRLALHARKIEFLHPKTDRLMSFESPVPPEMMVMIERERQVK